MQFCGLDLKQDSTAQYLSLDHPLRSLNLENLLAIIVLFASHSLGKCDSTGKFIGTIQNNQKLHPLLCQAMSLFFDWPQNFWNFLEQHQGQHSHQSRREIGIIKDFGGFDQTLYNNFPRETYFFLHQAFETYLVKQWDGGYLNTKLSRLEATTYTDRLLIPGTKAAQFLNINEASVIKLLEQECLQGVIRKMGKRNMVLAQVESVEAYKHQLAQAIKTQEAAEQLGIGRKAVVDLIHYNCIKAIRGPKLDGYPQWLIAPESLSNLLCKLDDLVGVKTEESECLISFCMALKKLSGLRYNTGKFVSVLLQDQIQPDLKIPGIGLNQYYFLAADIDQVIQQSVAMGKECFLTTRDVSKLLGVKEQVAAFWIKQGFIECHSQTQAERGF